MELIKLFYQELKSFSKSNWWIYIVFVTLVSYSIYHEGDENLFSILIISTAHFIADIFMMMMISSYSRGNLERGTYFQITSTVLFFLIKLYVGFTENVWHFIAADPIYLLAGIKNYNLDVKKINVKYINNTTLTILSLIIIVCVLIPLKYLLDINILDSTAKWIFIIGLFTFAIALSTTGNEKLRLNQSIFSLLLMVVGSTWVTYNSIISAQTNVNGLDISYIILPTTVLVYCIKKRWNG